MQNWTETIKFLNEIGLLPLLLLLLAIPGGLVLSLMAVKYILFRKFSIADAWNGWMADQKARTQIEVKLEERISDLTDQLKQIVAGNWDLRRYFDDRISKFEDEHKVMTQHLENLLLLAKKRKSDWIREPDTEMFLQPREKKP
jgi:hypothetical protein